MNNDHFDDIRSTGELSGFGVLGGDAMSSHQKAVASMASDGSGIEYKIHCDSCGVPNKITVTWEEFLYASCNQIPVDQARRAPWKYEPQWGGFHPNVGCKSCSMVLLLMITPDEARRHLRAAEQANRIPRGWVQQNSQILASRVNQGYQR